MIHKQSDLDYLEINHPNEELLKIAVPGDSFGEIALINDSKRTASVICSEDCYFLSLNKETYNEIVG